MLARRFRRTLSVAVLSCAVVQATLPAVALAQPAAGAADAKTRLANGDKAARAKDWAKALEEYTAANAAQKSAAAQEGIANARYELKQPAEAYEAYDELLKTYGAALPKPKKDAAQKRLAELDEQTGALSVKSNEDGATVLVDGKPIGKTPLASALRVVAGPHRVRVEKAGFAPFEAAPSVAGKGTTNVAVTLEGEVKKSRITVREKNNEQVRVIVDGVDVGAAPYTADIEPGEHEISVKSANLKSSVEKITIAKGETRDIVFAASSTMATLKVTVEGGKGIVKIDGKVVGEGQYSGDLPSGPHKLIVVREGYDTFEEDVELKDRETISRSITLKLSSVITTKQAQEESELIGGFYGGFGIVAAGLPAGTDSDISKRCDAGNGVSCSKRGLVSSILHGGGIQGYFGYHWDPVGMELFLQPLADVQYTEANFEASPLNLNADPKRTEKHVIVRVGGVAALRARVTLQTKTVRGSFAAGVGLSRRYSILGRDTTTPDNLKDEYAADPVGVWAPALSGDLSVGYRLAKSFTVLLGGWTLLESARAFNQETRTSPDPSRRLIPTDPKNLKPPVGLSTPSYLLSNGVQGFLGIYIGAQFGP
jgi:hypothetical protein